MYLTLRWWPLRGRNITGSRMVRNPEPTDEQWILIADRFFEVLMASARRSSPVFREHFVGPANRHRLTGFTNPASLSCNLLASTPGVKRIRRAAGVHATTAAAP